MMVTVRLIVHVPVTLILLSPLSPVSVSVSGVEERASQACLTTLNTSKKRQKTESWS